MKRRSIFSFLFLSFICLYAARSGAQTGMGDLGVTDQQWLGFMDRNAFHMGGLSYKMPLLAGELNLNAREEREVRNLFSTRNEIKDGEVDSSPRVLRQVKVVRRLLGSRDLDFRFWFFEEAMIDDGEDAAYQKNKHYSADQLAASLLVSVLQTQEFKDFKARKAAWLHSDVAGDAVDEYFSNWQTLFVNRVLLQIQKVKRRNLIDG